MKRATIVCTDRYGGRKLKGPVCRGQCEGLGVVPVKADDRNPVFRRLWLKAHKAKRHKCDGWHFVTCPRCGGTGKEPRR